MSHSAPTTEPSCPRSRGRSQARHDGAGAGDEEEDERWPAVAPAAAAVVAATGVECHSRRRSLRRGCRLVRPVLRQLSARRVGARRRVGDSQQPGRPSRLEPPQHLHQRLLGQEDGGQHEPQVLPTAVHPQLQVSYPLRASLQLLFISSNSFGREESNLVSLPMSAVPINNIDTPRVLSFLAAAPSIFHISCK